MRLLTRKIYRAFPELDPFEDEVCVRYVRRARRSSKGIAGWGLILLTIPVAMVFWSAIIWAGRVFLAGLADLYSIYLDGPGGIALALITITGFIWFPLLACLHVRDRWMHRCLRIQLSSVTCAGCGYSLFGLTHEGEGSDARVHCPECGDTIVLAHFGLGVGDIDPARA